jgi:hypothetical protein
MSMHIDNFHFDTVHNPPPLCGFISIISLKQIRNKRRALFLNYLSTVARYHHTLSLTSCILPRVESLLSTSSSKRESNTPIERKICRSFKSTASVLKSGCSICTAIHSNTRFLISSPSPLRWGKVGMGVDTVDPPPP